jgi:hypothetical protein
MIPAVTPSTSLVGFVGQGQPIPVRVLSIDGQAALTPKKFAVIISFTRELMNASIPSIEKVVRQTLDEAVGLARDSAMFDSAAATPTRPAGLRNGVTATSLSGLTGVGDAMVADLGLLVAAVAPVAAGAPILIVGNAKQIAKIRLRLFGRSIEGLEFFVSSTVEDGAVIAIASNVLCSAGDAAPRIDSSFQGTLVLDDTAPGQLVVGASTASGPARGLYQTDSIALRLIMEIDWGLRSSSGVAFMSSVIW